MRSKVFRSTPLRLILYLGSAFLAALGVAAVVAYGLIQDELSRRTDASIEDTYKVMAEAFDQSDVGDLVELVDSHIRATTGATEVFQLISPAGQAIASNMGQVPPPVGWSVRSAEEVNASTRQDQFRVYSGLMQGYQLSVGTSLRSARDIGGIVVVALGWTIGGLAVVTMLVGLIAAVRGQRRLDTIARTMVQISHGNLAARIPRSRRHDDIDALVASVNAALDRLAGLVEGMRQVSVDIAHELKSPLNRLSIAVSSSIEAAEAGRDPLPLLEDTQSEIHQVISTFDAMLRIAQIETGARRSRFTAIALFPILESIADAYGPVASDHQQSLQLDACPDLPGILGDKDLITQAIANLVENAIRHCPPDACITIRARHRDGVAISVGDNGPGISDADKPRVFDRFYRVEKSRTTPGSGLGLSLVKAIADLHGATVMLADNHPGLVVTLTFPTAEDSVA